MPDKKPSNAKIIDITGPDETVPSPNARPVVVTNRPVLTNDPMMVEEAAPSEAVALPSAPVVSRQAKTIVPLDASEEVAEPTKDTPAEGAPLAETDKGATEQETPAADPVNPDEKKPVPTEITPKEETEASTPDKKSPAPSPKPDAEAADKAEPVAKPQSDEEAASQQSAQDERVLGEEEARRQELEALIESGRYAVPINAVQRKRSRFITMVLCVLAVVLAVILLDAALDSGIVSVPGMPHTHFFQS